jgi:probable rRNA maturation factor
MAARPDGFAVINRQRGVRLGVGQLQRFADAVRAELGLAEAEAVICLVTDAEMARMNEKYRQKRGPTDVLSFPAQNNPRKRRAGLRQRTRVVQARAKRGASYLGDIAISPKTAERNAKKDGRELRMELRILILHGLLHLLGYDHETDQGEMHRLEKKLRRRFGLTWGI